MTYVERTDVETVLEQIATRSWTIAVSDFYHPPLPEPVIEHDEHTSSFFYIDTTDWTVHLNTVGTPQEMSEEKLESYLRSVCHHEIQHYLVCPYDGVMNGMMFARACRHVNDATAMFVCNLFADLVVDSKLLRRFPDLTHWRISSSISDSVSRVKNPSDLWRLIVSCYRTMWGFDIPSRVKIENETQLVSEEIVKVASRALDYENRWPKAVGKIAKIISEWLPQDDEQLPGCGTGKSDGEPDEEKDGPRTISVPLDIDGVMGSPVEVRNGDLARKCLDPDDSAMRDEEMERLAVEVEQRGGDLSDLRGVYILAGVGSKGRKWLRFWYRAKAKGILRFEVRRKTSSGSVPLTPELWRLGDPVEELDIVQSLQAFPVLVPNMSTRRWTKVESSGLESTPSLPDLLLVIDSSGSMNWSVRKKKASGPYHTALVGAFAALDYALKRGRRVAVINFSDDVREAGWTRERDRAEKTLLSYQGQGTVAPMRDVERKCSEAEEDVLVLMITDAEVANWDMLRKSIKKLSGLGHEIFIFHISQRSGSLSKKMKRGLSANGATLIPVNSPKDLPGLVVREVRRVYSE